MPAVPQRRVLASLIAAALVTAGFSYAGDARPLMAKVVKKTMAAKALIAEIEIAWRMADQPQKASSGRCR